MAIQQHPSSLSVLPFPFCRHTGPRAGIQSTTVLNVYTEG
ncbi:hypothetical protein IMCC21906_00110 [Spongiibacter sp. IMCC21906]|nr:hypothetical protein IMCC21906_00110 [Spongiibacter sp. IMCC21906]